jgi:hypothetical protein
VVGIILGTPFCLRSSWKICVGIEVAGEGDGSREKRERSGRGEDEAAMAMAIGAIATLARECAAMLIDLRWIAVVCAAGDEVLMMRLVDSRLVYWAGAWRLVTTVAWLR